MTYDFRTNQAGLYTKRTVRRQGFCLHPFGVWDIKQNHPLLAAVLRRETHPTLSAEAGVVDPRPHLFDRPFVRLQKMQDGGVPFDRLCEMQAPVISLCPLLPYVRPRGRNGMPRTCPRDPLSGRELPPVAAGVRHQPDERHQHFARQAQRHEDSSPLEHASTGDRGVNCCQPGLTEIFLFLLRNRKGVHALDVCISRRTE